MTLLMWLTLTACKTETPEKLLDTGWFTDTAADTDDTGSSSDCAHTIVSHQPEGGEGQWYWRNPLEVWTTSKNASSYRFALYDDELYQTEVTASWPSADSLRMVLETATPLKPRTSYTLVLEDCSSRTEVQFTTSALGEPLIEGPRSLVGRTWELDLVGATWTEPAGVAGLLQLYFTTPILFGVQYATDTEMRVLAGPGIDFDGVVIQDTNATTWTFPTLDFTDQPYFDASTESVEFVFADASIPVTDFQFTATFSADGQSIGGGIVSGLGDSRYLGPLLNDPNNPNAFCELATGLGVPCIPCPDGQPYCLYLSARNVDGTLAPGVTLQVVE